MTERIFDISDVLSVTTGRMVSIRHMDGVYDILSFLMGATIYTHQVPRAMDQCAPLVLAQYPQLSAVQMPDEFDDNAHVGRWLAVQMRCFGTTFSLTPVPPAQRVVLDPLEELRALMPGAEIIVIEASNEVTP